MDEAINQVISEIKAGLIFDSHFVINQLIRHHSDAYLEYAKTFSGSSITTAMHGHIGQKISRLDNVDQIGESYSENIRAKPSECACWKKK